MTDQEQAQFEQQIKETFWWYDENHPDFQDYWRFFGCLDIQSQLRNCATIGEWVAAASWHEIGVDTDTIEIWLDATDGY